MELKKDEAKNLKEWQIVLIVFCGIGLVCSFMLFLPAIQNLILDFGEKFIVHRPLTRSVWIEQFKNWREVIFVLTLLLLTIIGLACFFLSNKGKIFQNTFYGLIFLYIVLITTGFSSMFLVYTLPTKEMQKNVTESVPYFKISSAFGYQKPMGAGSTLDDFTDALMLIEAAHKSDKSPLVAAMLNERPSIEKKDPYQTLVEIYGEKNKDYKITSYPRYWHGYEIFLKPALLFTNYYGIRKVMMFFQIILMVFLIVLLIQKKYQTFIVPVAGTWLFFNPIALCLSMQYNAVFIVTLIELIAIVGFDKKYSSSKKLWVYHFFVAGCLTSFFDFLTYPLVTFGIPILLLLAMNNKNIKKSFISFIKCGAFWCAGYLLMWAGKWIGGSLITGTNILQDAKNSIVFRTSSSSPWVEHIKYFDVLGKNLKEGPVVFMIMIAAVIFFINFCKGKRPCKANLILLIAGVAPFVWYFVVKNHSHIHAWMTYRNFGITVFSILTFSVFMPTEGKKYTANDFVLLMKKHKIKICVILVIFMLALFGIYYGSVSSSLKIKKDVIANGKQLYSSENVSVYLRKNSLYYITTNKNDNSIRYFLHFYTDDNRVKDQIRYGFVNRDFNFSDYEIRLPFWGKHKMAVVRTPENFYFTEIGTGQFEGNVRFWQFRISMD